MALKSHWWASCGPMKGNEMKKSNKVQQVTKKGPVLAINEMHLLGKSVLVMVANVSEADMARMANGYGDISMMAFDVQRMFPSAKRANAFMLKKTGPLVYVQLTDEQFRSMAFVKWPSVVKWVYKQDPATGMEELEAVHVSSDYVLADDETHGDAKPIITHQAATSLQ